MGFPGGSLVKTLPCQAEDVGSDPGSESFHGEGNGNLLQYSCLGNPMNRGAWRATVHGVTKNGHNLASKQQQMYIYSNSWSTHAYFSHFWLTAFHLRFSFKKKSPIIYSIMFKFR